MTGISWTLHTENRPPSNSYSKLGTQALKQLRGLMWLSTDNQILQMQTLECWPLKRPEDSPHKYKYTKTSDSSLGTQTFQKFRELTPWTQTTCIINSNTHIYISIQILEYITSAISQTWNSEHGPQIHQNHTLGHTPKEFRNFTP